MRRAGGKPRDGKPRKGMMIRWTAKKRPRRKPTKETRAEKQVGSGRFYSTEYTLSEVRRWNMQQDMEQKTQQKMQQNGEAPLDLQE